MKSGQATAAAPVKAYADPAQIYKGTGLTFYDSLVLGFNAKYLWKFPNSSVLELYNKHVSLNHLDIGVATGYFLDNCKFPPGKVRLGLMDLSPYSLEAAARRLERFHAEVYYGDVLKPFSVKAPFDSVGMNYLVHCLPGTMETKAAAFRNVREVMNPGGVVFGVTVVEGGVAHNWLARKMLASLNEKGIFSTRQDTIEGLRRVLADCFSESTVELSGGVGKFWARR